MNPTSGLAVPTAVRGLAPRPGDAGSVYIALGDSVAFGEYRFEDAPCNGDRGYVAPYADYLARFNAGVRPQVINLAVDGETSTTFFKGGTPGSGPIPGEPAFALNTNYQAPYPTQHSLLVATVAAQKAAGGTIGTVSIQIGANDILLLTLDPAFFTKSPAERHALILAALMMFQSNYSQLLSELKARVPGAKLVLLGYYDPFAPFSQTPTSPLYPIAQVSRAGIQALNQIIAGEAAAFGARYIDLYAPFLGHELAFTDVTNSLILGNVHPTPAGYLAIVDQLVMGRPIRSVSTRDGAVGR
jgi:lysophospholipase L1-like esterase